MEEETTTIMAALSTLSPPHLTNLTHSILFLSHYHRRRLSYLLSSPLLFSLTLHRLLSLSLPDKILLIAHHLLSLLHPLTLHFLQPPRSPLLHHRPSLATMRLRDLDAVLLLLFLCETHQIDPEALDASPDQWPEVLSKICTDSMLSSLSGIWTCNAGVLMPYIEMVSRCRGFVSKMGFGGGVKEGREVPAARAAVVALPVVEVATRGVAECVICKEEMKEGREVCEMPCKHLFHWMCILPWLRKRNTCPVCRFQLPTDHVFGEIQRLWGLQIKAHDEH